MRTRLKATEPFVFHTRVNLQELTGLKAANIDQLLRHIKKVPSSSIYHHTHRFAEKHHRLSLVSSNDFAYWVGEILGDGMLGEKLAGIDTVRFRTIHDLREAIVGTIERHLDEERGSRRMFVYHGAEFYFVKSTSVILSTRYTACTLEEFTRLLKKVSTNSIYFHVFEARLRLEKRTNDFSYWLESSLGDTELADRISRLDPYIYSLEGLRKKIIGLLEKRA